MAIGIAMLLAACAAKPLPPAELAKLQGGTTKLVVYAECAPINRLTGLRLAGARYVVRVKGKVIARLRSCMSKRVSVPSGSHPISVAHQSGSLFGPQSRDGIFRPGATQYLFVYRSGSANVFHRWGTAAHAKQIIANGKSVKQFW
ncbi:MAG: hypothetical protein AAGJ70_01355 [Pseudomonadota bacterium]